MVSKGVLMLCCHALVFAGAALALHAAGAAGAARGRYDTATPHTPPYSRYKYIPLHPNDRYEADNGLMEESEPPRGGLAPSEMILTGLRTILDVVRNINKKRSQVAAATPHKANSTAIAVRRKGSLRPNSTDVVSGRGFEDYYDEHHDTTTTTTTPKPMKMSRYTDPWAGYYDWIINEGSFKFWSVFQLFTAALLLYACLSAIYYAKFNPIIPDYSMEYDDYFLQRTVGRNARSVDPWTYLLPSGLSWMNSETFQFIMNAIAKHYEEE